MCRTPGLDMPLPCTGSCATSATTLFLMKGPQRREKSKSPTHKSKKLQETQSSHVRNNTKTHKSNKKHVLHQSYSKWPEYISEKQSRSEGSLIMLPEPFGDRSEPE